jgi:two-component system, chemotaxis family, sensor kinase CheA
LALLQVMVFERGGFSYGLPLSAVSEVITADRTSSMEGQPSVELRGDLIPIGDLASMIGASAPPLPEHPPTLIVAASNRRVAAACDQVFGDEELVIKPLGPMLEAVPGYLGAAMLGDGRIVLVLDPTHLVKMPARAQGRPTHALVPPEEKPSRRVLVVDDQFSVRELQKSILETAGYQVDTARDGNDALERLRGNGGIDLVLTDIQMPGMDGFHLLREIRGDPKLESLPVVVVTSRSSEEDKRQGVEEGADAYIVKKEFGQQALLETLERLVGR